MEYNVSFKRGVGPGKGNRMKYIVKTIWSGYKLLFIASFLLNPPSSFLWFSIT